MSSSTDNALPDASKMVLTQDKATVLLVGIAVLVAIVVLYLLIDACITWRNKRRSMKSRNRQSK